jgi:Carboxypeptidase regulatory-like domain
VAREDRFPWRQQLHAAGGGRLQAARPDPRRDRRKPLEGEDRNEDVALAPGRISGTVSRDKQPAAGYTVRLESASSGGSLGSRTEPFGSVVSDEAGKYDISVWSGGTYILQLKSPAGAPVAGHKSVNLADDESQTIDFALNASTVTGVVVDPVGQPLPGAWVAMITGDGSIRATTDQDGAFAIDAQSQGHATVQAGKAGFGGSDRIDLELSPDGPVPPLTLALKRNNTLHGTVLTADGKPIAGALVTSISTSNDGVAAAWSATSDAEGGFDLQVPPGPPRAFVSGPACPLSAFDLVAPAAASDDDDPEDATDPNLLYCPALPAVIEITFLDASGKPVPHAGVILQSGDGVLPRRVLATHLLQLGLPADADGDGRLVIPDLAPGAYDLYLTSLSSEGAIAAGLQKGFLTSITLPPLATTELEVTIPPLRQ